MENPFAKYREPEEQNPFLKYRQEEPVAAPAPVKQEAAPPAPAASAPKAEANPFAQYAPNAPVVAPQEEGSFWGEVKKGLITSWEGLKNLPETLGLQSASLNVDRSMQVLNYLDRIDKGEKFGLGVGMGELPVEMTTTIDLYQRAKPEKRAELRSKVETEMKAQQEKVIKALPAYAEYQKKLEPYRGRVPDATDIGSLKDFRDWLGFNVSAGTVQLLPIMASAYVTRGAGRVAAPAGLGTTMALGETVENRLEYILDKVKTLPPEQQAQAVQEYITATNDTNMKVAIVSGALDLAGPVGTIIKKQLSKEAGKEVVKYATKREAAKAAVTQAPREIGEEFLTGGAQEITQIAGERAVGEQTGDVFSEKNVKRVFNAAAAEAAGSLSGSGINVGTSVGQQMLRERAERIATETLRQQARQAEVKAAEAEIGPVFDALVAKFQAEGKSEADAFRMAGKALAEGGIDLGSVSTQPRGGEPSVSVPSGTGEQQQPTGEPTASQPGTVAVPSTPADDAGGRAATAPAALTKGRVEPTLDVEQLMTQESRQRGVSEPTLEGELATPEETGRTEPTLEPIAAPEFQALEDQIRQTYEQSVADQIIARANELTQEAAELGASANPELVIRAAEAQVTETLSEEPAPQSTEVLDETALTEPTAETETAPTEAAAETATAAPAETTTVTGETPASEVPVNPATGLKPAGKRRGPKPKERTPEEQAAADAQRKDRQKVGRDAIRTAEAARATIERPFNVDDYDNMDAAKAAGMELQQLRIDALIDAFRILNDRNISPGTKAKQLARNTIDHPSVDRQERNLAEARAKQAASTTARAEPLLESTNSQPDPAFENFTDATQALDHIIKTGNPFERLLAQRIKPFLKGVKIVIVRDPNTDIPSQSLRDKFTNALGMYSESKKRGGTIYLNADPAFNGLSNMTVLHEALHGATMSKINAWIKNPDSVSPQARQAIQEMQGTMLQAYKYFAVLSFAGKTDAQIDRLGEAGAFTDLKEFVAYGLTQPEMQDFLMQVPGRYKFAKDTLNRGLLTRFVQSIRKMFDMGPQYDSAFQDLVVVTDQLLSAAPTPASGATVAALAKKVKGPTKLQNKLLRSQKATELNATLGELVMQTRNAKDAIRLLKATYDALTVGSIRKVLPTMTTMDITRWVGDRIANLPRINQAVQDMAGMRAKMIRELAQKVPEWAAFGQKYEQGARILGDVMHASTLLGVDPTKHPDSTAAIAADPELKSLDAKLNDPNTSAKSKVSVRGQITKRKNDIETVYKMWDALNQPANGKGEGRVIYDMAKKAYAETFALHEQLLLDKINASSVPGKANDASTPKGKLIASITQTFQEAKQLEVYFPLMRYGNYWLRVGKGKPGEFYMFESATARNNFARQRVEEMQKAGDSRSFEEIVEAEDIDFGDDLREMRAEIVESSQMLKNIFEMLDKNKVSDIEAVKDQIYQMYLMTLPEKDIRRKFTHRQGKTGFSADVLRNFIVSQHTAANQLSRLAYADQIRNAIGSAYAELAGNPDKLKLNAFVDEIALRAGAEMTPQVPGEFDWDKLASVGNQVVFYYMLTSPKSALVQMTQLPIVGLPTLTAEYGAAETAKITGRYSFLFNKFGTSKVDEAGNVITNWGQPSINDSNYVNKHPDPTYRAALKKAWQTAQDRDIFMSTYAADMTDRARVPSGKYQGWMGRGTRATLNFMGGAFHHLERITREIMYMSSFELEYARAKKEGLAEDAAVQRSIDKATSMVYESLFNYTQYNKPRLMKVPVARLATQFMSFPLQMTSYLVRNFYGMLPFLNKTEKKEAAIKFFGTVGMTWMFAGVVGLPGYSMIMGIAEGIRDALRPDMDDDEADEEYDADDDGNPLGKRSLDLWFREWFLPTYFGKESDLAKAMGLTDEQADMLQRGIKMGPISAVTDLNIGASVSLDGLWFRDDTPAETSKAAFQEMVFNFITGPFGSMGQQIAAAFDDFNNGQFNRGVEKLLPAFFRGAATSFRLKDEGLLTTQGAEIRNAEWYTTGKLLGQSLGFQSTEIAEIQKKNFIAKKMIMEIQKERTQVLKDLDLAVQRYENDPSDKTEQKLEDALIAIDRYNYKNGMLAINGETVSKSLAGRAQRRSEAIEGLIVSPKEAPYVYPLLEKSAVEQ